ncbi:MAG: sulfatase, partial [Planctomycetota bacterium]
AQAFTDAGWSTGAVVAARPVSSVYGFQHGFQVFHDAYPVRVKGPEVVKRAHGILEKLTDPFFLWVHFFDAHKPYKPREPFLSKARALAEGARPPAADPEHCGEDLTLYRGEVMGVDKDFGDLLEILEARDPGLVHTVVFVTSDHGHCFGEGGFLNEHQPSLLQATQHVVGILHLPGGARAGFRIAEPVSHVDVAPTLCEAAGLDALPGAQGRSLLPLVRGERWDAGGYFGKGVYMEAFENQLRKRLADGTFDDRRKRGLLAGRWKYWEWVDHPGGPFLYDLEQGEEMNLAPKMPEKVEAMKQALERIERSLPPGHPGEVEMTPQERQAMEELGYVQGEEPEQQK